jgi:hypothetical protein
MRLAQADDLSAFLSSSTDLVDVPPALDAHPEISNNEISIREKRIITPPL